MIRKADCTKQNTEYLFSKKDFSFQVYFDIYEYKTNSFRNILSFSFVEIYFLYGTNNISFCQAAIVQHDIVSIFILFSLELHKTQKKVEIKQVFARLYKSLRGRGYIQ